MNDDNNLSADDILEEPRHDATNPVPGQMAAQDGQDYPTMPADDITGDTSKFDEPKTDTAVDPTEAYHEGEDQAAGDAQSA